MSNINDLGKVITHLNRLRRRFMSERMRDTPAGGSLYPYLLALDRNPGASQDFIACHFFMDKGNVARCAKKLEDLGLIRREVSPDDRRQYCLFLTAEGADLIPVIRRYLGEWNEMVTSGFSEDEKKDVMRMLGSMEDNCNKAGAE